MDYINYSRKLEYLKWKIETRSTGTAYQLAEKLEVSERTVKRMISHLREQNELDIRFNRMRKTFFVAEG